MIAPIEIRISILDIWVGHASIILNFLEMNVVRCAVQSTQHDVYFLFDGVRYINS